MLSLPKQLIFSNYPAVMVQGIAQATQIKQIITKGNNLFEKTSKTRYLMISMKNICSFGFPPFLTMYSVKLFTHLSDARNFSTHIINNP